MSLIEGFIMTAPTNVPQTIIIPTAASDRKLMKEVMMSVSGAYTRIEAERDYIKESIECLSEDVGIPKKYLNKMARIFHKNNVDEVVAEIEEIEALIETIK